MVRKLPNVSIIADISNDSSSSQQNVSFYTHICFWRLPHNAYAASQLFNFKNVSPCQILLVIVKNHVFLFLQIQ